MKRYRKLVAAIVGVVILIAMQHYDIAAPGLSGIINEMIVGALTAWGVFQVPNSAD